EEPGGRSCSRRHDRPSHGSAGAGVAGSLGVGRLGGRGCARDLWREGSRRRVRGVHLGLRARTGARPGDHRVGDAFLAGGRSRQYRRSGIPPGPRRARHPGPASSAPASDGGHRVRAAPRRPGEPARQLADHRHRRAYHEQDGLAGVARDSRAGAGARDGAGGKCVRRPHAGSDGTGCDLGNGQRHRAPTANPNAFDLSGAGIPFVADSVSYSAGVTAGFTLTGRIAMLGHRQAGKVTLALDGAGHLTGSVNEALTPPDSIPLVPGFGGLALVVSQVPGSFGVSLMDGSPPVFDLTAAGSLSVGVGGKPYRAQATVEATNTGLRVSNLTLPTGADSLGVIDLTVVRLGLAHLQIPALSLDQSTGRWHFDLLFDGSLQFPQLDSLALPAVSGVELTETGFSIPQINLAQLSLPAVAVQGFTVTPLAFRTRSALTFNWFTGQLPSDWGFGFDLGLGFGTGAPGGLQGLELSVLNAGLAGGVFTGQIESPPLAQPIAI